MTRDIFLSYLELMCFFQGITVKMVAAGAEHTVAITEDGDLYGWGWGRYGNLGLGDRKDRNIPEKVSVISVCRLLVYRLLLKTQKSCYIMVYCTLFGNHMLQKTDMLTVSS